MKKLLVAVTLAFAAVFSLTSFGVFDVTASASEQEGVKVLTTEQLEEMNTVLENLKNRVNEKLEQGETDITVYGNVSFQDEPISLSFKEDSTLPMDAVNSDATARLVTPLATAASQMKTFKAEVKNTAGFNFSHRLDGTFLYASGKVKSYSYDTTLYGPFYGKTHSDKATKLDPSLVEIRSTGKFKALKYAPVEYTTHIVIHLYGSGTYKLKQASIG